MAGGVVLGLSNRDMYFGGISFYSILGSFAVAGLFSLFERYVDLHEKKDI
jgi:hypothetical protein